MSIIMLWFSLQYYLPPDTMVHKDFLKQVFKDEKKLMKRADLRTIVAPKYQEISVKNIWPLI